MIPPQDICEDLTDISIELDNDDANQVIDDFVQHIKGHDDPAPLLCNLLAVFLLASARQQRANVKEMPAAMSREKRKRRVKFVPPPARLLIFNLKGKAIPDVMSADRVYMAQYFKASILRRFSEEVVSDLARVYRMDEAKGISHEWEKYAPCGPLDVREAECSGHPTPPAA